MRPQPHWSRNASLEKLHLPWRHSTFKMNGVAGFNICPRGTVHFKVAGVQGGGKQIKMEASILPKVTNDLTTVPVSLVSRWKHQSGLELTDLDYGFPAGMDILLGGKAFNKAVLDGRRFTPTRAQSAFKTCFGWVLNGEANDKSQQRLTHIGAVAISNNSKWVYKWPVGKTFRWQKKKSKKQWGFGRWNVGARIHDLGYFS